MQALPDQPPSIYNRDDNCWFLDQESFLGRRGCTYPPAPDQMRTRAPSKFSPYTKQPYSDDQLPVVIERVVRSYLSDQ